MTTNLGFRDRLIRITLALVIASVGIYLRSPWGFVGLLPLLTAVIGFCPAYMPFGLSTCSRPQEKK
jgi:Protein of unknown function (DUF2892)